MKYQIGYNFVPPKLPPPTEEDNRIMAEFWAERHRQIEADATQWYRDWQARAAMNTSVPIPIPDQTQNMRLWEAWIESGMPLPMHQPIGLGRIIP